MKEKNILLPLFLMFFISINAQGIDKLNWLTGKWISEDEKNITIEKWEKISRKTIEGKGITNSKKEKKLINSESLRIVEMSGKIFYIAKVSHNSLPIAFKLIECSKNYALFENPDHDFPKSIEYKLINDNRLIVKVSNEKREFQIKFQK